MPANVVSTSIALASPVATCIQSNTSGACDPGEIINWAIGAIPAGGGVTVSMPFTALGTATAGTVITLAGNVLIGVASQATANASVTVSTTNSLSLAVQEDKNPVSLGNRMTYTLTYANRGATTSVTGTTLSFPIPAGTAFLAATGGGVLNGSNVEWNLGTLAATQSGEQQVVVAIDTNFTGLVIALNAATIAGTSLVAESAQATANTRIVAPVTGRASPPLGLAIEMNPDPVRPNEQLTVELTVTNRGTSALTGVVLQARMPTVAVAISNAVASGSTCVQANTSGACDPTELVNWALGALPAGAGVTLSLPMTVNSAATPGRLAIMEALARDDSGNGAVAGHVAGVDSDSPLTLAVDEDKNPLENGGAEVYTIIYGNRGATASVTGTTLTFRLPCCWSLLSATGGGTQTGSNLDDQVVQWTLGSIPAGQTGQQQVVVLPSAGANPGELITEDSVVIAGNTLIPESSRATAVSRFSTASPPLALAIEMNPDPARPTELVTAQLTVTNSGATPLTGVVLQARMPEGVNSIAVQASPGATCVQANTSGACDPQELVSWALGAIPAGGGITLSVPMVAATALAAGRRITLEALVKDDAANQAVAEKTIGVESDDPLWLAVDDDKNPVTQSNVVTYTLAYGNRATTSSIAGTKLTFPIPDGASFVSATGGGTQVGNTVQWTLGSFPATQSDQQQVVVSANFAPTLVVNAASITGSAVFTETARANAVTRIEDAPPLSLAIEANPDPARPSEELTTEITVTNRGSTPLTGVVLQVRVPQGVNGFNPVGMTLGGTCVQLNTSGSCDFTELANWNLGVIPAGTGVTVSMPMVIAAGADPGGLISIEALARDDGVNRSVLQQTIAVDSDNPLTLAVDEERDAVPGNGTVTYNLSYGNRAATGNVTGTTMSFPLPPEAVLLGSTGGTVVDGNVVWNLGSIAAGAGGRRKVTLSVPGAVTLGSILRIDAAQMHGNVVAGVVPDAVRATTATRVEASQPLGLTAVWAPDPAAAGAALTGTLTVTNNSGVSLTGVVLQARMPQSVNSINPLVLTGGGTCIQLNTSGGCEPTELANWNIGPMLAGASVTVSMPLVITAGTVNGRLITIESLVKDDSGRLSTLQKTVLLNPFTDTDADGVAQIYDNCTGVANADQRDTDFDGFGNRCDGDFDENNIVSFPDLAIFKGRFGTTNPNADLDGNGSVNFTDLAIFKGLFGKAPGPSAMAP
jgi:uncharacterized repeat protein (TIGR01451 family)